MKKKTSILILSLCGFFFVVFVAIVAIALSSLRSSSGSQKKLFAKGTRIGVIEVNGVIMDSKKTLESIERIEEDDSLKGAILRVNSPGGAVAPSQEIYQGLRKLSAKKPVYTSMSSLAASGGYYISCGTQKIFADPGTITGSIGVIMQFANLSKLYQWAKFTPYNIKTGKFKDIGSTEREMRADEKLLLQGMMDNVLGQFRQAIVAGRKIPYEKVVALSDGRIFSGEQAKLVKLVDELGGLQDAADALVKDMKGQGKPILIYPAKHRHMLIEKLFDDDDEGEYGQSSSRTSRIFSLARLFLSEGGGEGTGLVESTLSALGHPNWGPMYLLPLGR